jgi:tRNA threonylcarbamoyladenosine biosynthesis protein TsaE
VTAERVTAPRALAPPSQDGLTLSELRSWGETIGGAITAPLVIAVSGDLGAGKTTLIQAICRGYGVAGEVTSPTFALVHEYASGRGPVFHLDLYRLRGPAELTNAGWDDIVNAEAIVLIEWPERAGDRLPREAVRISLSEDPSDASRRVARVS